MTLKYERAERFNFSEAVDKNCFPFGVISIIDFICLVVRGNCKNHFVGNGIVDVLLHLLFYFLQQYVLLNLLCFLVVGLKYLLLGRKC